ncbi:Gp138 family membrane-puncturing spike protein [Paenibacillus periandrae]|uniref:Gp138 family membrane-puncturing spike protein n=1 Tax=Paenibacillus periandrae TaxID=1761741 RepID=UPI001F0922B3|nr:Gp138 family membrane-puncturing spike protein [Paenibacillus periandrae]
MGDFDKALDAMINESLLNLHTALPCIVISFDPVGMTCDLQPVFKQKHNDGSLVTPSSVIKAPCVWQRFLIGEEEKDFKPVYVAGDLVLAIIAERAIDHALSGVVADPKFNRHHELQDAIVVGRLSG